MSNDTYQIKDCPYPWQWVVILSSGYVGPCCWYNGNIGCINLQSFDSIWNGNVMKELREDILNNRCNRGCANSACRYVKQMKK